jgi:hypothetical protein
VDARRWLLTDFSASSAKELDQKYPAGGDERAGLTNIIGFFEAAGVLVSRGLLHEDVFFDAPFALGAIWPRLKPILEEWRAASEDPAELENFYWLGRRYEVWREKRWKPKLEAFPPDEEPNRVEPHVRGFQQQ